MSCIACHSLGEVEHLEVAVSELAPVHILDLARHLYFFERCAPLECAAPDSSVDYLNGFGYLDVFEVGVARESISRDELCAVWDSVGAVGLCLRIEFQRLHILAEKYAVLRGVDLICRVNIYGGNGLVVEHVFAYHLDRGRDIELADSALADEVPRYLFCAILDGHLCGSL